MLLESLCTDMGQSIDMNGETVSEGGARCGTQQLLTKVIKLVFCFKVQPSLSHEDKEGFILK